MKTPDQILGKTGNGLPSSSWTSPTQTTSKDRNSQDEPIGQETKLTINKLFLRFMAIYGHKFKSRFESEEELRFTKREWALSLRDFSEGQVMEAVERCKETKAWMPEISEFLSILRDLGGDFGLPATRDAYIEACLHAEHPRRHAWSHPAVYLAGRNTGWFELRSEDETDILPRFRYQYEVLCRRVREGEELELPVVPAIENKQESTTARFMLAFAEEHGLAPEFACSLLYYLTLPRGSATRERFKQQAQAQIEAQGMAIELPEAAGPVTGN